MKLLYVVPKINNEGGVARVLSLKANYLVSKWGYDVHILTQNNGNVNPFYEFDQRITFHDMILEGNLLRFFSDFKNSLKKHIATIKPDVVIVCDNGLKAYLYPFILNRNIPIVFENHGSRFLEEQEVQSVFYPGFIQSLKYKFKDFAADRFTRFVALSQESLKEWNIKNGTVITNPCWVETVDSAPLKSKQAIAVGRLVYEKGFDRMLQVWKRVIEKHSDWTLSIYGKTDVNFDLKALVKQLNIENNVAFFEPVQDIEKKYLESSFLLMTSRFEGFGMVLTEAMACGLPCIAYDCPCGPRSIIQDGVNGFLVEDDNTELFAEKVNQLIEDENLRIRLGEEAKFSVEKYNIDNVMNQWNQFFKSFKNSQQ